MTIQVLLNIEGLDSRQTVSGVRRVFCDGQFLKAVDDAEQTIHAFNMDHVIAWKRIDGREPEK